MSRGVGEVGVRIMARAPGNWEDGGGVKDEVVRVGGDMNLTRSGEASFDNWWGAADSEHDAERNRGVSGRAPSVVGINESCDDW